MAFNPFSAFRKNQKVWMAGVLLLCMITFVLCTGVGGDLSDRLLRIFAPRHGNVLAQLDGRSIRAEDVQQIKTQRKIADKFVRLSMERVLANIEQRVNKLDPGSGKTGQAQRKVVLERLQLIEQELKPRMARSHYFEGDLKLDSLLDFMLWLKQADRLEIDLTSDDVRQMFEKEVFALTPVAELLTGVETSRIIQIDMRREFPGVTDSAVLQALGDEYRVRIARLASYLAQPGTYQRRYQPNKEAIRFLQFMKLRLPQFHSEEVRAPLSPAQLWDIYKEKRTQYDLSLVPVRVEFFRDKIKEPDTDKLKSFFEAHKSQPFDPASAKPGFEVPQMVKAAWIMADPASPAYERPAQAVSLLETTPRVAVVGPFDPLANAVLFGASSLAFDASMQRNYDAARRQSSQPDFKLTIPEILELDREAKYLMASLTEPALPALLSYLAKPTPAGVASAVASAGADPFAAIAPYLAEAYTPVQAEAEKLLAEENKPRLELAVALATLADTSPLAAPAIWLNADRTPRFLPLQAVKRAFQKNYEDNLARTWTAANMTAAKDKLDQLAGKDRAMEIWVPKLIAQYGFRHGATEKFYDKYGLDAAVELAPLREAFESDRVGININTGTSGTPEMLKEGDLYKLFFGSGDSGSGRYVARPWPPILDIKENLQRGLPARRVSLFEKSGKPFLFWKTDERFAHSPEKLDEVKERVLAAWQTDKAREELALPRAKEIAQALQKSGGDFSPVIREEAKKLNTSPIAIRGLAVLHPDVVGDPQGAGQSRSYREFPLPKELIVDRDNANLYPREDMVKQLLALTNLEKPLQSDYKPLDDLNKELFQITKKLPEKERAGKFVQVLTNRPHTVFWVGAVVGVPGADLKDFADAYKHAIGFPVDTFVTQAQEDAAKQYVDALLGQLRRELNFTFTGSEEARKSFDTSD